MARAQVGEPRGRAPIRDPSAWTRQGAGAEPGARPPAGREAGGRASLAPLAVRGESFFWKRLFGLTGVVPVGAFVVFHLFANARSLAGPAAYDAELAALRRTPLVVWLELFLIVLPLAFHSAYGLASALRGGLNVARYPYARNWLYVLQRLSGLVALVFIAYHYYEFRLAEWLFGRTVDFRAVASDLAQPAVLAFYAVGVTAVAFHLAQGLWHFAVDFGLVVGPRARSQATAALAFVFAAVLGLGVAALAGFLR